MNKSAADQIRELQIKLFSIQEEKKGVGDFVGGIFKSFTKVAKAAEALGPEVRIINKKGDLEFWRQIEGSNKYKLESVNGKPIPDPPIEYADEVLERKKQNFRNVEPDLDPANNPETQKRLAYIEKAIALHEKQVEHFVKFGKLYFDPEMKNWMFANRATVRETIAKFYPEAIPKFKADKGLELKFWQTAEEEGKKGKPTNIKKILIALGIIALLMYNKDKIIPKKDKPDDQGGAGSKVSPTDGSNATTIPADEISWTALGYRRLEGQSVSKNSKGEWVTPSGAKAQDPEIIKKLEELAAMSSAQRKDLKSRQDTPMQVFLYDPSEGGSSNQTNPDISLQQNKVPSSKW